MEFLKLFQNHAEYDSFVSGGTMVKPNVSHCVQENEVHYSPNVIMTVRYNVADASTPTQLYTYLLEEDLTVNGVLMFDKAVIDGVEVSIADLDAASGQTQLSAGEHTVKYTLKDPTFIGEEFDEETETTSVGATFMYCSSITSIEIPNSVTSIGFTAFQSCSGLTSVTIPNSVISIGDEAFAGCSGLTSVNIPNSVTSIGFAAFSWCDGLTSVNIPNSVTSIGVQAFYGCSGLTSVTIPNSVTSIGDGAFSWCDGLTSVTIPNSVNTIGGGAFQNCSGLTSVTIGNSVTSIGNYAFWDCSGLTSVVSLATIAPTIGSNTFHGVKTNGTLTVPSGSSGYDVWMGTGNYYLGKYNWTKVEQ